jgi:hypothetical protein
MHEDSNMNSHRLISMMLMNRPDNMKLFNKPTKDGLTLGPESTARGFFFPDG